jgi:hypothetical protein
MSHPKLAVEGWSKTERRFFCYCCGSHEWHRFCTCCGGRACYRCIEWQYECRELGDAWCKLMHVPLKTCTHGEER